MPTSRPAKIAKPAPRSSGEGKARAAAKTLGLVPGTSEFQAFVQKHKMPNSSTGNMKDADAIESLLTTMLVDYNVHNTMHLGANAKYLRFDMRQFIRALPDLRNTRHTRMPHVIADILTGMNFSTRFGTWALTEYEAHTYLLVSLAPQENILTYRLLPYAGQDDKQKPFVKAYTLLCPDFEIEEDEECVDDEPSVDDGDDDYETWGHDRLRAETTRRKLLWTKADYTEKQMIDALLNDDACTGRHSSSAPSA